MSRLFRKKDDVPKRSLWQRVKDVVRTDVGVLLRGGVDQGSLEALETLLIESDFGVTTSLALVADVERLAKRGDVKTDEEFRHALADGVEAALRKGNAIPRSAWPRRVQPSCWSLG